MMCREYDVLNISFSVVQLIRFSIIFVQPLGHTNGRILFLEAPDIPNLISPPYLFHLKYMYKKCRNYSPMVDRGFQVNPNFS